MTRRRRASSAPQRVGSADGLTSSRPSIEVPAEDAAGGRGRQPEGEEPGEQPEGEEPGERPEKATGPAGDEALTGRGRHTGRKVEQTKDDTDEGWGEARDDDASARWLRENRPPHWD